MAKPFGWSDLPEPVKRRAMAQIAKAAPATLPKGMNKLEARYADTLELLKRAGAVAEWYFEAVTFKLADDTRYTPDFMVILASREIEFHETKGHFRDDAKVKIKVAARLFPFRFKLVRWVANNWKIEEIAQ